MMNKSGVVSDVMSMAKHKVDEDRDAKKIEE